MDTRSRPALVVALLLAGCSPVTRLRVAEGIVVGALAYEYMDNRFERLNGAWDAIEQAFPERGTDSPYNRIGDPASWAEHTITAAAIAGAGALVAKAVGASPRQGFHEFSGLALAFYGVREASDAIANDSGRCAFRDCVDRPFYQKGVYFGYAIDGVGDVVGPTLLWRLSR